MQALLRPRVGCTGLGGAWRHGATWGAPACHAALDVGDCLQIVHAAQVHAAHLACLLPLLRLRLPLLSTAMLLLLYMYFLLPPVLPLLQPLWPCWQELVLLPPAGCWS